MEDPLKEIRTIIFDLIATNSPDNQQGAVYRYYTPDAGFRSPFVRVDPGPSSIEDILGILQWYRILSPAIVRFKIENVVYIKRRKVLLVDTTQEFHLFFSPLKSGTSRVLTRLTLTQDNDNGLYFIALHEDLYESEGVAAMIAQPLVSLTGFTLRTFASISLLLAKPFQVFNYWRPKKSGIAYVKELTKWRAANYPKPNCPKDKTPADSDLENVQQLKLAEQGPAGSTDHEYGQNQQEVLGDKGQSKHVLGTSALPRYITSQLERSSVVNDSSQ